MTKVIPFSGQYAMNLGVHIEGLSNGKEKILEIINMPEEKRIDIGKKSKEYAEKYHSPEYVGNKLHSIIQKVLNT